MSEVRVSEETRWSWPVLVGRSPEAEVTISPYGAQVLSWRPAGHDEVLWASPATGWVQGRAIRGGIPICFPWFGARAGAVAHGFARTHRWEVDRADGGASSSVRLALVAPPPPWEDLHATFEVFAGAALTTVFTVENRGAAPLECEVALHGYFAVGDVTRVHVEGLDGASYLDKVDGTRKLRADGPWRPTGEVDAVHARVEGPVTLVDPVMGRRITVSAEGGSAVVVWSPGPAKAAAMPDVGDDWRRFLCVERARLAPRAFVLPPGGQGRLVQRVEVAPLRP